MDETNKEKLLIYSDSLEKDLDEEVKKDAHIVDWCCEIINRFIDLYIAAEDREVYLQSIYRKIRKDSKNQSSN